MEPVSLSVFFTSVLVIFASFVFLCYLYLKYVIYNVWNEKGIPHDKPNIPLGNVPLSFLKGDIIHSSIIKDTYMKFKKCRFNGLYILCEPVLVINDPDLIRDILVKNFPQFPNRGRLMDEHKDALSANLSTMNDEKWKTQRAKLSPAFTSGKLKLMYPLIEEICNKLISAIDKELDKDNQIEIKEFATRYTIDCIASIAYGCNADSLNDRDSIFYKYGKTSGYMGRLYILIFVFAPQLIKFMPLPEKRKDNAKFFIDLFCDMVEHRRKENIARNDILNMIMQLVDNGIIEDENGVQSNKSSTEQLDKLTMMEGVGQSFTFFSAGQDTTSSLITCCIYELALNPDIQQQLFDEIYQVQLSTSDVIYDKIFEMQYMDMVFQETIRKYPAGAFLQRICTEDYQIPDSTVIIKKGMRVLIPTSGIHADPDIYPEPEKFDPTRFTPENNAKRHHFTYLPFGDGPRQCIAKRLGILKSKMALFYLVLNYKFSACEATPKTISFLTDHIALVPCDVPLKVDKRKLKA